MSVPNQSISYTLPNGIRIEARTNGDADPSQSGNGWSSIDVVAIHPDGTIETLCCAEFDSEVEKMRIYAYDGKTDEMTFECDDFQFYGGDCDAHP